MTEPETPRGAASFYHGTWRAIAIVALCIGAGLFVDKLSGGFAAGSAPHSSPSADAQATAPIALPKPHFITGTGTDIPAAGTTATRLGGFTPFSYGNTSNLTAASNTR